MPPCKSASPVRQRRAPAPPRSEPHLRNGSCEKMLHGRKKPRHDIRKSTALRHNNPRRLGLGFGHSWKLRTQEIEERTRARTSIRLVFRHAKQKNHQTENFGILDAAKRRLLLLLLPQFGDKLAKVHVDSACRGPVRRTLIVKTSAQCAIRFRKRSERLNGPGIIN